MDSSLEKLIGEDIQEAIKVIEIYAKTIKKAEFRPYTDDEA